MKKIIYIAYAHLTEKVVQDSYIDFLRARGIVVEYWDLVTLLFGGDKEANTINTSYIFTPTTYKNLEERLRLPENRDALYVVLIVYEGRFIRLFRLLSKFCHKMVFILWGQFPSRVASKWRKKILGGLSHPIRLGYEIFNRLKGIACKKLHYVRPFDIVFAAGDAAITSHPDARKVVPINLADYDNFIMAQSNQRKIVEEPYAVFLDIYLPYQKNNLRLNNLKALDPHDYYATCNRFFNLVERKFNVKVVIAAHPRSNYGKNVFEGRELYRGMTPELVKDANFVISHNSTSLSYAVLSFKPILFIYTDEMKRLYENTATMILIHEIANYLDSNVYNIDKITNSSQIAMSCVSKEHYENYKYNYLTTRESEHTTTQEIFWSEISAC